MNHSGITPLTPPGKAVAVRTSGPWRELALIGLAGSLLWVAAYLYAAGPISWDELIYLDLSFHPAPEAWLLNRYGHIYLQRAFLLLAGSPLSGARLYWSFLVVATGTLVYGVARWFRPSGNTPNGLLAVFLYLSQPVILYYAGATYVDYTVMFLVMLGLTFYLAWLRGAEAGLSLRRLAWSLVALGAICLWAFKAKESGAMLAVLALGLVADRAGRRQARAGAQRLILLATGGALGLMLLMTLDAVYLGDAWFALRPENWRRLVTFNLNQRPRLELSWFGYIFTTQTVALFLLAFWPLARLDAHRYDWRRRMVWLIPLALIVILSLSMISGSFGVIRRYFIPAVPVLAVLGSQSLLLDRARWIEQRRLIRAALLNGVLFSLLGAGLLALLLRAGLNQDWTARGFFNAIGFALVLCAMLTAFVLFRTWDRWSLGALLAGIALMTLPPLAGVLLEHGPVAAASRARFAPYDTYAAELGTADAFRLYVSRNLYEEEGLLCRNALYCEYMYTLYFGRPAEPGQFVYADPLAQPPDPGVTHLLLTTRDWERLTAAGLTATLARFVPAPAPAGGPELPYRLLVVP